MSRRALLFAGLWILLAAAPVVAQSRSASPQLVVIDTDIGDDIDDAFAVGLALSSPDLHILGITSAWGDTSLRSHLLDRLLCETGRTVIPVATGIKTSSSATFTQARWAQRQPDEAHPEAAAFLLDQIKQHPGEITLIALGPLTNIGAAIQHDPATFRQLRRIVLMGGSVRRGYDNLGYDPDPQLDSRMIDAEYNIKSDVPAAQAVFASGVPLYVAPLDSTQIKLDGYRRDLIFSRSTNLTDALSLLYRQWAGGGEREPTLYDVVPVAFAIDPKMCPMTPLNLAVDDKGYTREIPGKPNSFVCLRSGTDVFFDLFMPRLLDQRLAGSCARLP